MVAQIKAQKEGPSLLKHLGMLRIEGIVSSTLFLSLVFKNNWKIKHMGKQKVSKAFSLLTTKLIVKNLIYTYERVNIKIVNHRTKIIHPEELRVSRVECMCPVGL